MKRALAIFLALILCIGLFACGKNADTTNGGAAPAEGGQSSTSDGGTSTAGGGQESPSGSGGDGGSDGGGSGAITPSGALQGYLDDEVDHYARDTYEIVFLTNDLGALNARWYAALQSLEERLNVKMTAVSAEGDKEVYLSNIELLLTRGYDGALVCCTYEVQERATELLYETGVPWVAFANVLLDENNQTVAPVVLLDQYDAGRKAMSWLIDNYKSFMGDVDTSKIGAISTAASVLADHAMRVAGQRDIFEATFPGQPFYELDTSSAGYSGADLVSAQAAYELVGATVSANPQIEYWLVSGTGEQFGPGSARALEGLGKTTENALVCTVSHGSSVVDWDSMSEDTESVNVACLYIADILYAVPALSGLIALIDGRSTYDTLWLEKTPQNYRYGNNFGVWEAETQVITRWNYQEIIDEVNSVANT